MLTDADGCVMVHCWQLASKAEQSVADIIARAESKVVYIL
jgi:hypothetical protein